MSNRLNVPQRLVETQFQASDPAASAWVSANAGSGKTHVLVQRVIRLLLEGADPGKILCLTYTKAAAANMANRVFETLAKWTALDDDALGRAIAEVENRKPGPARRLVARRLFAQALETPGGLKVQTIHAFCAALLYQFPFEAGVSSRFEVLEERAEAELIDRLRLEVMREAANAPETPLGRALATALMAGADSTFAEVVREAIGQRAAVSGWIARAGGVAQALEELSRSLGLAANDTLEKIEAEFFESPHLPAHEWPAVMATLAGGNKTDRDHIERFQLAQLRRGTESIDAYLRIFCTDQLRLRKAILTKPLAGANPGLDARLQAEQGRICALLERRRAARILQRTAALITVTDAVIGRYAAKKAQRGLLDFNDLVGKTLALLQAEAAAWVHYKLDLGIDHVLIDEAQDTSPAQWDLVARLTAEFTAGEGARPKKRSVFAVGDEKQSIYSFQGAAPHRFDEMRRHFEAAHAASRLPFKPVKLQYSFRSSPVILEAVDAVFGRPEAYAGLTADPVPTLHEAIYADAPGCVEVWPMLVPEPSQEVEPWDAPFDAVPEDSPRARLATRIAETVRVLTTCGDHLTGKPVKPGDVLVLVRQRGALFEGIIRALKKARVEVAGADRLVLTEHIAVMDLLSLGDALLLPEDDLALAEALKSPLFGFDDDALFSVCWNRSGTLRAALRERAPSDAAVAAAAAKLDRLETEAKRARPFNFYAALLGAEGGRKAFLGRLGPEAADALDEFLALALEYERTETPSLQGFVSWMRAADVEVKRDMDIARDEVRVMTVHGAKGLEARLVILADTTTRPSGPRDPSILTLDVAGLPPDAAAPLVWSGRKDDDVAVVGEARQAARLAAEEENRRLLYVALTRAADRLIVCGAQGKQKRPAGCWYDLVYEALRPGAREADADAGSEKVLRWEKAGPGTVQRELGLSAPAERIEAAPDWLRRHAPASSAAPAIAASRAGATRQAPRLVRAETRDGLARGRLVHRLLQSLPDLPPEHRGRAARGFLARSGEGLSDDAIDAILREVEAVLGHAAFSPLFAPGTRAEVPLVGRLPRAGRDPLPVTGQVDRLAVTPECVLIADYKTDRDPPQSLAAIPRAYVTQLALYSALLGMLYPGRAVRAALVWTQGPELVELPSSLLAEAVTALCGARGAGAPFLDAPTGAA